MSPEQVPQRQPHAVLDLPSRRLKALKIEKLLGLTPPPSGVIKMLEIGCGTGGISSYFGTHPELKCDVDAVDVVDLRQMTEGYRFTQVSGNLLPFADAGFDVVISNHVIEHVGDRASQAEHLRQIRRVLKPGGMGYLAVPNRWQLVEPHYRLAFLSWLPRSLRTPYLKLSGKGNFYDCEPLTLIELESLLAAAGFEFRNVCVQGMHLMFELEPATSRLRPLLRSMPVTWLRAFKGLIPTLIYVFR
jgi:SAM-dependent methyltransferase